MQLDACDCLPVCNTYFYFIFLLNYVMSIFESGSILLNVRADIDSLTFFAVVNFKVNIVLLFKFK